ncbi:MAG: hypothetical protein ONB23_05715 [candidate division KSB1 bacterium]|nr:hypothetical protein [candidate division KSB1 bacterium]
MGRRAMDGPGNALSQARITALILKMQLRSYWNRLFRTRGTSRLRAPLLLLLWMGFAGWVGVVYYETFRALGSLDPSQRMLEGLVLAMSAGFFVILLLGGGASATSALALSGETQYLLTIPTSRATVFRLRLLEVSLLNSTFVLAFLPSAVIALGVARSAAWVYYPLGLGLAFLFVILISNLGAWVSFAIGRILPPRRAREILSALTGLVFLVSWIGLQGLRNRMVPSGAPGTGPDRVVGLFGKDEILRSWALPSTWFAQAWWKLSSGDLLGGLAWLSAIAVISVLVHEGTARLADSLWAGGFGEAGTLRRKKLTETLPAPKIRGRFREFLTREAVLLVRDYHQLMRVIVLAVVAIAIPAVARTGGEESGAPWQALLMPLFLVAVAGVQFAALLIPLEGRAFWLIRVGPGAIRNIVLAKWLIGGMATGLVLAAAVSVAAFTSHVGPTVLWALPGCFLVAVAATAVGLLIGAYFGQFDWDHPRRALRSPAGFLMMGGALALAVGIVGPVAVVAKLVRTQGFAIFLVADLVALAEALLAALAVAPAIRRLQKLEWSA